MTRATVMLVGFLLLLAPPSSVVGQVEKKQSPDRGSLLKEGDLVRVNYVRFGVPDRLVIWPTLEQLKQNMRDRIAEAKSGRVNSFENRLYIGHNTPATIDQLVSFSVAGQEWGSAQITFSAGPLRGQKFWVNLERLRSAREPDPAEKLTDFQKFVEIPPIDPDYEPDVGDSVVLAYRAPETLSISLPVENQGEKKKKKKNAWKLSPVFMVPIEPVASENGETLRPPEILDCARVASGTTAVVELVNEKFVKTRITSGPFKGQKWFTLWENICRPEVFAELNVDEGDRAENAQSGTPKTGKARQVTRKKRLPATTVLPPGTDLVLTDLAVNTSGSGNFVNVDGRFRNTSDAPLKGILVTISFQDRSGKLVRSQTAFCQPNTIEPGESASFGAIAESDARVARVKLAFKDFKKAFKWVDESGKDAHE